MEGNWNRRITLEDNGKGYCRKEYGDRGWEMRTREGATPCRVRTVHQGAPGELQHSTLTAANNSIPRAETRWDSRLSVTYFYLKIITINNKKGRRKRLQVMDHRLEQPFHGGIFISKIIFSYAHHTSTKGWKINKWGALGRVRESIIDLLDVIVSEWYLSTRKW